MKKLLIFIFAVFFAQQDAKAWGYKSPLYLRCTSYPLNAGVVYAVSRDAYHSYYDEEGHNIYIEDYFDLVVKEEDHAPTIDFKMITYLGEYYVHVISVDKGYTFMGFAQAKYLGDEYDLWEYFEEHNDDFYHPDIKETDYVFDPETVVKDTNPFGYKQANYWAAGYVSSEYEGEDCFLDIPNEYCYAVFTRVDVSNEEKGKTEIYPRVNEVGDEVTLTCTADDFEYWLETSTGRKISDREYSFTVTGKKTYTAVYSKDLNGIASPSVSPQEDTLYDLQGRRINKLTLPKGIYIYNGKKVIMK